MAKKKRLFSQSYDLENNPKQGTLSKLGNIQIYAEDIQPESEMFKFNTKQGSDAENYNQSSIIIFFIIKVYF